MPWRSRPVTTTSAAPWPLAVRPVSARSALDCSSPGCGFSVIALLLRVLDRRRDELGAGPAGGADGGAAGVDRLVLDLGVQLEDRVQQHLRPRRAAGQVHVDRHDVVDTLDYCVVVEHAAR